MVFCCFDESPIDGDPRAGFPRTWQTNLLNAPCNEPVCCLAGLFCPMCTAFSLRKEALGGSLEEYICCQGYFDCAPCFRAGTCGEQSSPEVCLCIESCCCTHFAAQATRFYIMDTRQIMPDPVDNQIIRFHNCLQCLACICELAAMFSQDGDLIDAAQTIRLIADLVYMILLSCFAAQVKAELKAEAAGKVPRPSAPGNQVMHRGPPPQPGYGGGQPGYGGQVQPGYGQQPMPMAQPNYAQPYPGGQQMYGQPIGQPTYGQAQPMAYAQPGYAQPMPVATMAMPQAVPVQGMRRA